MDLTGKKALVTGASSGIGRALAKALAARGVELAISGRRKDALDLLANEIVAASGPRPHVLIADLAQRGAAAELGEQAIAALHRVDILVNNAGVAMGGSQLVAADDDEPRELFETNYWSALALARVLGPGMRERGVGALVNVASIGAFTTLPLAGHYSSSKAALQMATETLRLELRNTGVQVLAVMPGPVETGMFAEMNEIPGAKKILGRMPKGDADVLARKIVRALERNKRNIVYPTSLNIVRHFPTMALRLGGPMMRGIDVNDGRKLMGGSHGSELAQNARAAYEAGR